MKLVIVESPTKSRTIEKYLGNEYKVVATRGHIRDLSLSGEGSLGVDIKDDFKPDYVVSPRAVKTISYLQKIAQDAEEIYLATDPDREGEAIAWHVADVLNLDIDKTKRLEFHEITKNAVKESIDQARKLDMNLVYSQEARRILDRIMGFKLSGWLQRKIQARSAGRVQSVVLKLINEKDKEIDEFKEELSYGLTVNVSDGKENFVFEAVDDKKEILRSKKIEELDILKDKLEKDLVVESIEKKIVKKYPFPPFTTSSLQQEAFSKLNFSASKTNKIAQSLYEGITLEKETTGLITYMRTDSIRISGLFVYTANNYIKDTFGDNYLGFVKTQKKDSKVQDAHEAIRPTRVEYTPDSIEKYLSKDEYKLYKLIWDRAVSSLLKEAEYEDIDVYAKSGDVNFICKSSSLLFDGFKKIYGVYEKSKKDKEPNFIEKNIYKISESSVDTHKNKPPFPYSEASIIKKMEEVGIGRPSTYASTLESLKRSNYISIDKRYIKPTANGKKADEELSKYFSDIINTTYTSNMEEELDKIAEGNNNKNKFLNDFYKELEENLAKVKIDLKNEKPRYYLEEICPKCGKRLVIRQGRYGEYVTCEDRPTCDYIKPKEVEIFDPSKHSKCPKCNEGFIVEKKGRYGTFRGCSNYPKCDYIENNNTNKVKKRWKKK